MTTPRKPKKKKPSPARKFGNSFNPYNEGALKKQVPKVVNHFKI
jgi:hypothetical protein